MSTGQFPKRRESDEQAKKRISKLNVQDKPKIPEFFRTRISPSGRLTR